MRQHSMLHDGSGERGRGGNNGSQMPPGAGLHYGVDTYNRRSSGKSFDCAHRQARLRAHALLH